MDQLPTDNCSLESNIFFVIAIKNLVFWKKNLANNRLDDRQKYFYVTGYKTTRLGLTAFSRKRNSQLSRIYYTKNYWYPITVGLAKLPQR